MSEARFRSREEYDRWKRTRGADDSSTTPIAKTKTGYIDEHLMAGERVVYRAYRHWAIFLLPGSVCVLLLPSLLKGRPGVEFLTLLLMALIVLPAFVIYRTSEFAVTTRRVLAKHGLISRRSMEILLTKIEGIEINEGLLGRVFGYGTVTVKGTGGGRDLLPRIDRPFEFRKKLQEQIEAMGSP